MVTLEHSFLIDFTNMGVRGARETPIRLIVPVYTRAGARELPASTSERESREASIRTRARESYQWRKSGMPSPEWQDCPNRYAVKNIFLNPLTS